MIDMRFVALSLLMLLSSCNEIKKPDWELVTDAAAFGPRDTAQPIAFAGHIWLSNGYFDSQRPVIRDLWRSEVGEETGSKWHKVLDETPFDHHSAVAVLNGKIYAAKNTVWRSDDGIKWEKLTDQGPTQFADALPMMRAFKGRLWFFWRDEIASSADGITWRAEGKGRYGPRSSYGVIANKDWIYVLGGALHNENNPKEKSYPTQTSVNDVWRSADGKVWTRLVKHAGWSPRKWPGVVAHNNKLYLFGGFDNLVGDNIGELWESEDGANWKRVVTDHEPSSRHWPSLFSSGEYLILAAGNGWPVINDVWKIKLAE